MVQPHVMVVPYPAQAHVISLLEFSLCLVRHGITVTFANTDFNHRRIMQSLSKSDGRLQEGVNMVSFPDGMEAWENRNDMKKVTAHIDTFMSAELEALIVRINGGKEEGEKITCVVADMSMAVALQVAEKLGLRRATYGPAPATFYALISNIPNLISGGVIDDNGKPLKKEMVELSPEMPMMNSTDFAWSSIGDDATQNIFFDSLRRNRELFEKFAEWQLCNSSIELEPGAFSLCPDMLPVGPIQAAGNFGGGGHICPEDDSCLPWLDQHPPNSVIYVAFGTSAVLNTTQFKELALGLELTGRPFLWVVRQDIIDDVDNAYPKGFEIRTRNLGRIVKWAPQQRVLSHPSVACFVTHCGWNSTTEGIIHGVPLLCWAYYADQLMNQVYICDEWKVGLGFNKDESGIIRRWEIRDKVEQIMSDGGFKDRALDLQEKTLSSVRVGSSRQNFNEFVMWIKESHATKKNLYRHPILSQINLVRNCN